MTPRPNPDADRDPLAEYLAGDPDTVRAAAPPEPGEHQWAAALRNIHTRLARPAEPLPHPGWRSLWVVSAAIATTAAAVVVWLAFRPPAPRENGPVPEQAQNKPLEVAPHPHVVAPDPLAEFAVLPIAADDDVVFERVPGTGVFPVGAHPLPDLMRLASADEVELDDPDELWPPVAPSPGDAPMLFAPRPR